MLTGSPAAADGNAQAVDVLFGLYGAGGFAREIMPLARESLGRYADARPGLKFGLVFVETEPDRSEVNGVRLMSEAEFLAAEFGHRLFNVAIANSASRQAIAERCMAQGATPFTLSAESSIVYDGNEIGEGGIFCAYCLVTANIRIGRFFHSNFYSYVAHDCVIGDYVTFAPRVQCNGNVHIHDHAYIGASAVLKQGTPDRPLVIGEGAIVGMGAVVTKDVPPGATVVGNPARPLIKA